MATAKRIMQFLRETLPHGEYRLTDWNVVVSHEELAGYVLGEIMSEGSANTSAHHIEKHDDIDIVYYPSERVLKVLKHTVLLVDTEYGFGDYVYEEIGQLDLNEE